ncbi:hypothetical protein O181_058505 [Austropuccinia psidii MF-1]|uniref:Uncharacterized protein n=1 Tax=Austropuccinia psidii MF-1 TaxID=1389203 RepID=A0A9Q3E9U2_9BASI|nr:hypothetical protein [Austropuccinia psidii MF-1]
MKDGRSDEEERALSQLWFSRPPCHNCPKEKKKVSAIEQVPDKESPTEDSESYSMGDFIREKSDQDQEPRE